MTDTHRAANIAQAQAFVAALNDHVDRCSAKIEDVELRPVVLNKRGKLVPAKNLGSDGIGLRQELYDIHRQLDRLHRAFPELLNRDPSV